MASLILRRVSCQGWRGSRSAQRITTSGDAIGDCQKPPRPPAPGNAQVAGWGTCPAISVGRFKPEASTDPFLIESNFIIVLLPEFDTEKVSVCPKALATKKHTSDSRPSFPLNIFPSPEAL